MSKFYSESYFLSPFEQYVTGRHFYIYENSARSGNVSSVIFFLYKYFHITLNEAIYAHAQAN